MKRFCCSFLCLALAALLLLSGCAPFSSALFRPSPSPVPTPVSQVGQTLVGKDGEWRYHLGASAPSAAPLGWTDPAFDDGGWETGRGGFGSKDGAPYQTDGFSAQTLLPLTDENSNPLPSYFFRKAFSVSDPAAVPALEGSFLYDDAAIVYLNGVEIFSGNLPAEGYESNLSFGAKSAQDEPRTGRFRVAAGMLLSGTNVLCVELHQAGESSSDIFFSFQGLTVAENADTLSIDGLCLFTGGDGTVTARWFGDGSPMTLRFGPAGKGSYATDAASVSPVLSAGEGDTRYSAPMTGLAPATGYAYWVESDSGRTVEHAFTTPGKDALSFLFLGDPQLTGDTAASALEHALGIFPDCAFALLGGDQVNSGSDTEQYRLLLRTEGFQSLPLAAAMGNHEDPALYELYFAPEGLPASGRDYAFSYGDVLFVCLDSNAGEAADHGAFLRERIGAGDWAYVIVCMHHSLFSMGKHGDDGDTAARARAYSALFSQCDVDLVLSGHDHIYARTKCMEGMLPVSAPDGGTLKKLTGQTLYLSAGSSTGSKYYDRSEDVDAAPFACVSEADRPTATRIQIDRRGILLETRYADDGSPLDEVLLTRAAPRNNRESAATPAPLTGDALKAALIESEAQYLLSTQLPNGAFATYPVSEGDNSVNPYFGDYTAMALLKAGQVEPVRAYLNWHFTHLNAADYDVNGLPYTIYDYTVSMENGQVVSETSSMSYDSTDSYAATLLLLLQAYYEATGDGELIRSYYPFIAGVINVLLSTQMEGLTPARPDYEILYLMDNCEVRLALAAADGLLGEVLLPGLSGTDGESGRALREEVQSMLTAMPAAIEERLWAEETGRYAYAVQPNNQKTGFDPAVFYPDSIAQLSPMIYALLSPADPRAKALYGAFCADWDWTSLSYLDSGATGHYWGMAPYCAAVMGDEARLSAYLSAYRARTADSHAYPLFNGDAAWVLLACAYQA